MAYFDCIVGGSGKGNTLVVTCADDLAGATITCTNGTKTYTKTCPSTAPYEVTFYGLAAGTWTVSATVSGNTYTTTVVVTDYEAELGGFNWRTWVDTASQLDSSDYDSLDEVLADELAVRELCLEHACVDYMASVAASNEDLEIVINNDYCAKWINLSDYALDFLGANTVIKALMDEADKYGYGEWVITDDTTTPPTWGAKGNVPVMTSNSAPYGTASASNQNANAYQAFNGSDSGYDGGSIAYSGTITYAFTNPICPSKVSFRNNTNTDGNVRIYTYKVEGYDGTSWEDLTETLSVSDRVTVGALTEAEISTTKYYTQLRLNMLSGSQYIGCAHLQFYGRELSVSVPKMDTNTTPYGEAISSGANSGYEAFKAFDNNASTQFVSPSVTDSFVAYKFNKPIKLRAFSYVQWGYDTSKSWYGINTFKIVGKNGDDSWEDITETLTATRDTNTHVLSVNSEDTYDTIGLFILDSTNTSAVTCGVSSVQFYGLDYSEKEFEEGTTKKWLYDHGVELVDMDLTGYSEYHAAVVDVDGIKNFDNIELSIPAGDYKCLIGTQEKVDFTPYTYLMGKYRFKSIVGNAQLKIVGVKQDDSNASSSISLTQLYASSNAQSAIDVSSINALDYPIFRTYGYTPNVGNLAQDFEVYELWLE